MNLSDEAGSPVESACSVADPAAIFGGHRPEEPLAAFDGESLLGSWALRASDHNVGAAGVLWNFSLIPSLSSTSFDVVNSFYPAGLAIPDADPDGVIHITSIGTRIADLDVRMIATHTWVGDLVISLEHLGTGTKVKLLDRILGCGGDDINATFDDEAATPAGASCNDTPPAVSGPVQPAESLASFDGEPANGIWKLTVSDESFRDTGTLDSWCLMVRWDLLLSDGFETGGLDAWQ